MTKRKQPFNPFYVMLLIVGIAFTITACAYALMMVRATRPGQADSSQASAAAGEESGLMKLLDDRGMQILGVEVLLLALATVGAIGLDQWRGNRKTSPVRLDGDQVGQERADRRDSNEIVNHG